jgi:GNAT superfamily N-acetyltransferase
MSGNPKAARQIKNQVSQATLTIRSAVVTDAGRIAELAGVLGYENAAAEIADRLEHLLGREEDRVLVAVASNGRVVGWTHGAEHVLLEAERRCEILGLVVDAGYRGAGIGRQLVKALESWAAERGLPMVAVRSNVVRQESHPFYERLGFERVKTQHAYRKAL